MVDLKTIYRTETKNFAEKRRLEIDKKWHRSMHHWALIVFLFINNISCSPGETTMPLRFDSGNISPYGMVSTQIKINGKIFPLLVDTGASKISLALKKKVIDAISVDYTGEKTCFDSISGQHCYPNLVVKEVSLGHITMHNVNGISIDEVWGGIDPIEQAGAFENGLIGLELLTQFNVLFNYPDSSITLLPHGQFSNEINSNKFKKIPFTLQGGILTKMKINQQEVHLIWDTGAIPSILNHGKFDNMKLTPCPLNLPYAGHDCQIIKIDDFSTLSDHSLGETWFMVDNLPKNIHFDGLIGDNFFREHLVFFDFKNHQIYIPETPQLG